MRRLTSTEVRSHFLRFFEEKGHQRVASSPLVPANDKSLLFTNSGMAQFKDVFLGFDKRPYKRAVTAQKCLRAGGKHNDLDNVGYTDRHHTFFEMLGNFSFGDYFKTDAIPYAWEFLTSPGWLGLDPRHLWITVFGGGRLFGPGSDEIPWDEEAHACWTKTLLAAGFSAEEAERRITRIPTTDNFWMMGDIGPCGPCSEIFYNRNAGADGFEGADPDKADVCVEIWNLVFMQFNRSERGELKPLPAPCVDTGMGLERISSVMQDVPGNFDIDLFRDLLGAVYRETGAGSAQAGGEQRSSLRVIADHLRAAAFLIADGIFPGNDGRGYVLRRIIRRAIRHGHQIGAKELFFHRLAKPLAGLMGDAYPELGERCREIEHALLKEEESFAKTLSTGMAILGREIERLQREKLGTVGGAVAFELYDTYGFPLDLTMDIARGKGVAVDEDGFERLMREQRERSRAASHFSAESVVEYAGEATQFVGYGRLECAAHVAALFVGDVPAEEVGAGQQAVAVLTPTPFYARAGGQVGDAGLIVSGDVSAVVMDTYRLRNDVSGSLVRIAEGVLKAGAEVRCSVDFPQRALTAANHSATHLVHAALRSVLGAQVEQRGSLVAPDHLRFDFSHHGPLKREQMQEIERMVNDHVRRNHAVAVRETDYDEAVESGAMALFGEKYGDRVRVVSISPFSVELCGGTHVDRSGDIGLFKLGSESAVAAGIRRIEAFSGASAVDAVQRTERLAWEIADKVKVPADRIAERVERLHQVSHELKCELEAMRVRLVREDARRLVSDARQIGGARVAVCAVDGKSLPELRGMAEQILSTDPRCAMLLTSVADGAVVLVALAGKSLAGSIDARDMVKAAAAEVDGRGGGKPELAQARGKNAAGVQAAHAAAERLIAERLAAR